MGLNKERSFAIATFGCKVNQYDAEAIIEQMVDLGYHRVPWDEPAHVYVINTCSVTGRSEAKCRQAIRQAKRRNPDALIIVTGCYAQVSPGELAMLNGVDAVIGISERDRFAEILRQAEQGMRHIPVYGARPSRTAPFGAGISRFAQRTRAFIKIQEGCDHFCSYCIVPYARGASRSRPPESVFSEIGRLLDAGFKEVVLAGVHVGMWGRDLGPDYHLGWLLRQVALRFPELLRLRLSSIEPQEISDQLIDAFADAKVLCEHFHIPLQSGSNRILALMNRGYTREQFSRLVHAIREAKRGAAVSTDMIVGFPGETETDFQESMEILRQLEFSRLHVFRFSPRKGTPAANMPGQVPAAVREHRAHTMLKLGRELSQKFIRQHISKQAEILVEQEKAHGLLCGLTRDYLRVCFEGGDELINSIVQVKVIKAYADGAWGELITGNSKNG